MRAAIQAILSATSAVAAAPATAQDFVHFESPHSHPLELVPGAGRLLAVNTADGRLEVFAIGPTGLPVHEASIAVGVEPVAVRARTASEAWVVNRVSDSVSIVDLGRLCVVDTVEVGDEPTDVVFAGTPARAFVSVAHRNELEVFDPSMPHAVHGRVPVAGKEPRALATDGVRVYATIFQSGNATTVVPAHLVSSPDHSPYPGAPNPPPNAGSDFDPPMNPGLPPPPPTALVVRRDAAGAWRDDNGADWSKAVAWDVVDHDVAIVDAATLAVTHVGGAFTTPTSVAPLPGGRALAIGMDSRNERRFEKHVQGTFVRALGAVIDAASSTIAQPFDLNPHLDYSVPSVPMLVRRISVGDPRAVVASADGARAWVSGMGSSNVALVDAATGARLATGAAGHGTTGLALDERRGLLYAASRFDGLVTVLDAQSLATVAEVRFHDPTPEVVRRGRPHLFDTHRTSGLGQASCATCHFDARTDGLPWDLGNPAGEVAAFNQLCFGPDGQLGEFDCDPWHPMKGPMVGQTLVGMSGTEPFHWRGDRAYIATFAHTAHNLQGADGDMSELELKHMQDFLGSIAQAPNPNRTLEGGYLPEVEGGNPEAGAAIFQAGSAGEFSCAHCHAGPLGSGNFVVRPDLSGEAQLFAVPHLSVLRDKQGFATRGAGFGHDGTFPTLVDFLGTPGTHFNAALPGGAQGVRDLAAYLLSWDASAHPLAAGNPLLGTHPSVGAQVTVRADRPGTAARRDRLRAIATAGKSELVAHARVGDEERGWLLQSGALRSDRAGESAAVADLDALAASGTPVTWTLVPVTTGLRAIDRDGDGALDGDERDACSDPADAASVPGGGACRADVAGGDARVDGNDLGALLAQWGPGGGSADLDCSGAVDGADLARLLGAWGPCAP